VLVVHMVAAAAPVQTAVADTAVVVAVH